MPGDTVQIPEVPKQSELALPEPRWPAIAAFVTTWLCPARSARRTRHVSLWSAWAIHFVAAALTFLTITIAVSLIDHRHPLKYLEYMLKEFTGNQWQDAMLILATSLIGIEIAFLLLALIVMPWGGGEERLRTSCSHALRITWLHTAHALPTVLLVCVLSLLYNEAQQSYNKVHAYPTWPTTWPTAPTMPPGPRSPNSQAWRDYQAASAEYGRQLNRLNEQYGQAYETWKRHRPFIVKYGAIPVFWIGVACYLWITWALYRAVGQGSGLPPTARDPMCEFCGYNLAVTPTDSRCPECGELVMESLGPAVRPGTAWDRTRRGDRLRAWWRCGIDAIIRPSRFGRQIQTRVRTYGYRMFLATHLAFVFLFAGMGIAACLLYDMYSHPSMHDPTEILFVLPGVFGSITILAALTIAGLTAAFVGVIHSLKNERNLLGASMQTACYLGLYMTSWTAVGSLLAFAAWVMEDKHILRPFAQQLQMPLELMLFCLWLMPNVAFLAGYLCLVWRGMAAAQHANH